MLTTMQPRCPGAQPCSRVTIAAGVLSIYSWSLISIPKLVLSTQTLRLAGLLAQAADLTGIMLEPSRAGAGSPGHLIVQNACRMLLTSLSGLPGTAQSMPRS